MNEEITSCEKHGCQIKHAKVKISGSEQIIEICPECEKRRNPENGISLEAGSENKSPLI